MLSSNYMPRNYERRARRMLRFINQRRISRIRIRLMNNSNTIDRLVQITTPQITNNVFENDFFNGTSFHDNNSVETLILPAGCSGNSIFL